jgi:hypothetical protein
MTCGLPFSHADRLPRNAGGVKHRCQREASQTQERTGLYGSCSLLKADMSASKRITVNHYNQANAASEHWIIALSLL